MSRETRLLLVTIVVSVLLLVALARFRFPQQPSSGVPAPVVAPLDRLLARDTLGDMATAMRALEPIVGRAVVTLRVGVAADDRGTGSREALSLVPALRLRDDVVVAMLPAGARVIDVVGGMGDPPSVVGADVVRGLTALRVPRQAAPTLSLSPPLDGNDAALVALIEGSGAGPAIRPTFTGWAGRVRDPRWHSPLLALDRRASTGTFVFTLQGQLAGLVIETASDAALVPAAELVEASEALIAGRRSQAGDVGVEVQPLTHALAAATGASAGAVVRALDPTGPANGLLVPGDVVVALDDLPVYSTLAFERHVAALPAGVAVRMSIVRLGTPMSLSLTARDRPGQTTVPATPLGARMAPASRQGTRITAVTRGSPADRAGLAAGDLVARLGGDASPAPEQVERAWASAAPGAAVMFVVSRGGVPLVLAVRKP